MRNRGGKLMLERHSRIRRLSLGGQQGVRQTVAVHYNRFRGRHPLVIGNSYTVMQKHFQRQCAELDLIPWRRRMSASEETGARLIISPGVRHRRQ